MSNFNVQFVYDLVDKLSPQLKAIEKNLANVNKQVSNQSGFEKKLETIKNLGNSFENYAKKTAILSVSLGAIGIAALKQASNLEALQIKMEILTGSVEKGTKLYKDLVKLGAETPFDTSELTTATNIMMGYGLSVEKAFNNVKRIGDIVSLTGGDMQRVALSFSQAFAGNKVSGEEIREFLNNGVPIVKILAESMNKPLDKIKKLASDGKISFAILEKAIEKATSKGGKFYDGMNRLSQTLSALFITLKENVNIALAEFGNEIAKTLDLKNNMKEISNILAKITQAFKNLSPETKKLIVFGSLGFIAFTAIAGVLAVIITIFTTIGGALAGIVGLFTLANIGAVALGTTIGSLIGAGIGYAIIKMKKFFNWVKEIKDMFVEIWEKIKSIVSSIKMFSLKGFDKVFGTNFANNQTLIQQPMQQQSPFGFSGQIGVNFNNLPQQTTITTRQSTPNLNLGINSVYAN